MLLAITATDVAFVSVIVTGVTAIVGPLVTWQIAKAGRKHELDVDVSRRNHEARRDVYVDMLKWTRLTNDRLVAYAEGDEQSETTDEDAEETLSMVARVAAFGSTTVNTKLDEFDDAWSDAWDEIAAAETPATRSPREPWMSTRQRGSTGSSCSSSRTSSLTE